MNEGAYLCGVDEAGRGPLAGPVVAAAVILPHHHPIEGLRDSKQLSALQREALAPLIQTHALAFCVAEASIAEIDTLNILQATLLAMQRAVQGLSLSPDIEAKLFIQIDGNRAPTLPYPCETIVKGDQKVNAISAASILAKVHRDQLMQAAHIQYPQYHFDAHKGYGTALHLKQLRRHGPSPLHRKSFAPVRALLPTRSST